MKINLYDFDGTIYDGDSSVDFFLFNLKKKPILIFHVFKMLYALIVYKLHIINKTKMKEIVFSYLSRLNDVGYLAQLFWNNNFKKIKPFYLLKNHDKDVIISASPEFLLLPLKEKLGVYMIIASRVDMQTGKFDGLNCHDEEKVRRLKEEIKEFDVMEAYSDSRADDPILKLASNSYYVKKNTIKRTNF